MHCFAAGKGLLVCYASQSFSLVLLSSYVCDAGLVVLAFVLASARCYGCVKLCPCAGRHLLFFAAAKKSRQKKAANAASSCSCLRAPNVPTLHTATCLFAFVANAPSQRITHFTHLRCSTPCQIVHGRPGGKLCVGRGATHATLR